ncbi:Glu-tRNA(Gln) amidotransferase subunit GatE [Candidatus Pacearchaeota archaeon]|nr:Glu-tRNA(Gln) amidotransferase subunit GatE [Candidatus Pacearchaeota archaeon]
MEKAEVLDYAKIGFKSGLEIHQQLDAGKLFCSCPGFLRTEKPDFEISRKLHAIAGESGEIDEAVKHEASFDREFIYQGYNETTCLVELDEAPPKFINEEALDIVIQIALLLNCEIIPVTQIMRKTVIDGSNTGGFQRSVMIAKDGCIDTKEGKVRIKSIVLEEDAARIISKEKEKAVYRLDRLGIPLIEIATEPDMKNPEQVKESALYLGDILRACKVKRGIGTIRQDVNISIKGHPRVEIKGFQDVKMFIPTIEKEIERQQKSNDKKSEVRKAEPDGTTTFMRPMPGSARMYPETDLPLLHISRGRINNLKANLPKLRKDIKEELKQRGLNDEMIHLIVSENKVEEFKSLLPLSKDANLIAKMLVLWPKDFSRKLNKIVEFETDVIESVLDAVRKNKIGISNVQDVLFDIANGKKLEDAMKINNINLDELENFIAILIKEKPGLSIGGYMGLIMQKFKGKISGKEIADALKKYVK